MKSKVKTHKCKACKAGLKQGYCQNETCVYSSWPQTVQVEDLYHLSYAELETKYSVRKFHWEVVTEIVDDILSMPSRNVALPETGSFLDVVNNTAKTLGLTPSPAEAIMAARIFIEKTQQKV